jgi:hypothetical protein
MGKNGIRMGGEWCQNGRRKPVSMIVSAELFTFEPVNGLKF